MKLIVGFTFGTITALLVASYLIPGQTHIETIVQTEVVTQQVVTTLNLEHLKDQVESLNEALYEECIRVLQRTSDLPIPMIQQYVDRHYEGDACKAADKVWSYGW